MFQYTSETILNSNEGNLLPVGATTPVRFAALAADGKVATGALADTLIIDGVTSIKVKDICAVYHTRYAAAANAVATITVPTATADDVLRLRIRLTEQGNSRSILQDAYLHKAKPFTYEIISSGVPATDAAAFVKAINKELAETDFKLFSVAVSGAVITVTCADEYLRFADDAALAVPVGGETMSLGKVVLSSSMPLTGKEDYTELATGTVTVAGNQGAGTVKRLIKDLRIPTSAKVDPFELKDGGMPIPGGKYDQYLIEVVTERRHIAGGVVGSINNSLTSFVFFVESGALTDWDGVLALAAAANTNAAVKLSGVPASTAGVIEGAIDNGAYVAKASIAGTEDVVVSDGSKPANTTAGEIVKNA